MQKGQSFYQDSKVSISFTKGTPETYYICSGLIRADRNYETKIVFKKRFVGTDTPPLTSQCNCINWTKESHCCHSVALFLSYHHHLEQDKITPSEPENENPPLPMATNFGVTVHDYGTSINGPHFLLGSMPNSTYSSLQYLLHAKKIVNFPIPQSFEATLIIDIRTKETESDIELSNPKISYKIQYADESFEKKISIFEHLYIFNWSKGEVYQLEADLRELLRKIRIHGHMFSINDYIQLANHSTSKKLCTIVIDGKAFSEIPTVHPHGHIALTTNHAKKNHISFTITFIDEQNVPGPLPEFLQAFTFSEGMLSTFSRKKDAYQFLSSFNESIEHGIQSYKKDLIPSSKKRRWNELIDMTTSSEFTKIYFSYREQLNFFDNTLMVKIFTSLYQNFGEMFFRFSQYNKRTHELTFQISMSNLFRGLTTFYSALAPFGISIYYNKNEIKKWNSRIRFERKSTFNSWFDLELHISNEDLEIIKNADLESGMALTSSGLVYLSTEQKELLKFVKRYTKYEAKQIEKAKTDKTVEGEEPKDELNKFLLPFHRARIFELFELHKLGLDGALTEEEEQLCLNLASFKEIPETPISDHLVDVLREYQKTGHHWLSFLYKHRLGACLADDMGLGKTVQTISFLESIYEKMHKVLIICPVTLLLNWQKEIEKFSKMEFEIYHGGERHLSDDKKIILTSYGIMKKEVHTTFEKMKFDVIVLDEVQHLKNIRSQGAYAARQLNADFRICLTGTPVENDLAEFYNIMDLSIPGIWGDLQFIKTTSDKKSRLLARKTAKPFILRRTKDQVLSDLPPKIENTVYLEFKEKEDELYKNKLKEIQSRILLSTSKRKYGEILKGLLELRQSCLWRTDDPQVVSTKVEFLLETVEQLLEENHQAIIFSQFTTYLDIIQKEFDKRLWRYSRIDGSQTIKHRQKEVDRFQNGDNRLFLISLKAGGVGLNLTAASYVFVMDPWWNPAVETQAIDRAHRIGQLNTLNVYRPIIKNSVEEKILVLQDMKKKLFYDLLPENDDNYFTGKLSMKDFQDLLT